MADYLEITSLDGTRRVLVGDEPLTIGRHENNAIVLTDIKSSRFHCVIEKRLTGYSIRDLSSRNGTLLNGRRIRAARLAPGDEILIGKTRITLTAGEASPDDTIEQLSEEDLVEELSEADIIAEEPAVAEADDEPRLPVEAGTADVDVPDAGNALRATLKALPGPFAEDQIRIVNARGQQALDEGQDRAQAVLVLRLLLLICLRTRASDIHVEPRSDRFQIRIRVDGGMVEVVVLPKDLGVKLSAVVKVLCDIDIGQRNLIQEGHFASRVPAAAPGGALRRVDYRVSFAPTVVGQKLVIRILDPATGLLKLPDLKLPGWMLEELGRTIQLESGMVLACGPTGSGKTTSLYALIRSLDMRQRNIVTIENPVEVQIDGVTQLPADETEERSFSALLRSVLRQDPDVIMVGEIRDRETARIAMQASITGHLVLSTLHTRDTVGALFRLMDLGAEPYMVSQGLHVILAQRLVRQLCPHCKVQADPTPQELEKLGSLAGGLKYICAPRGCPRCLGTGFSGRRAFYELLKVTAAMRDIVLHQPSTQQLQQAIDDPRFVTLRHSGYELVADGVVPFEEIERTMG